jgi:hypothetical protein
MNHSNARRHRPGRCPTHPTSKRAVFRTPKAFRTIAQGCRGSGYPGQRNRFLCYPEGVALDLRTPFRRRLTQPEAYNVTPIGPCETEAGAGRNPFRVENCWEHRPRVASQPWAMMDNAFGVRNRPMSVLSLLGQRPSRRTAHVHGQALEARLRICRQSRTWVAA